MTIRPRPWVFVAALFVACILLFVFKSFTVPILKTGAIAKLDGIEVNGDRQSLLIRGESRDNPILLFLHGGPGMPSMFLAHRFQRDLEKQFIVVHWDQRGSGKSFRAELDPETISTRQLLDDLYVVTDNLQAELSGNQIYLLGHSHGSYLGMLAVHERPELYEAYIGVGQVVNPAKAFSLQKTELERRRSELGIGPDIEIDKQNLEQLLFEAHGQLYCCQSFAPLLLTGLLAPEYSLMDAYNVKRGSNFSSQHMKYNVISHPLELAVRQVDVPTFFISGKHDLTTPATLSKAYLDDLSAPMNKYYEIDEAAHFPFFEQPQEFALVLAEIVERTSK